MCDQNIRVEWLLQAERKWVQKAAIQLLMRRAMKAWIQFREYQQHKRGAALTAHMHFETTLMSHALHAWRLLCVHALPSEHGCATAVGMEACRQAEFPEVVGCGHSGRCRGDDTRPSSAGAGAGPRVGRHAHVVVGHVRQASGSKKRQNQKRSQSAPRAAGSRLTKYDSTTIQKQDLENSCVSSLESSAYPDCASMFAGFGVQLTTEGIQWTRRVIVIRSQNGFMRI